MTDHRMVQGDADVTSEPLRADEAGIRLPLGTPPFGHPRFESAMQPAEPGEES